MQNNDVFLISVFVVSYLCSQCVRGSCQLLFSGSLLCMLDIVGVCSVVTNCYVCRIVLSVFDETREVNSSFGIFTVYVIVGLCLMLCDIW